MCAMYLKNMFDLGVCLLAFQRSVIFLICNVVNIFEFAMSKTSSQGKSLTLDTSLNFWNIMQWNLMCNLECVAATKFQKIWLFNVKKKDMESFFFNWFFKND